MNFQIDALAKALAAVYGTGEVTNLETEESTELVEYLNKNGIYLAVANEDVADGPIQRALGIRE